MPLSGRERFYFVIAVVVCSTILGVPMYISANTDTVLPDDAITVMSDHNSRVKLNIAGLPTDHWAEIETVVKEFARLHPEFTEVTLVQVFWVPRDQFSPPRVQDQVTGLLLTHRPKTTHRCEK